VVRAVRSLTPPAAGRSPDVEEPEPLPAEFSRRRRRRPHSPRRSCRHLHRTLTYIRNDLHLRPGVALNPGTGCTPLRSAGRAELGHDHVRSTPAGRPELYRERAPKLTALRERVDRDGLPIDLCVDGGVKENNAARAAAWAPQCWCSGTGVYRPDLAVNEAVARLRASIGERSNVFI